MTLFKIDNAEFQGRSHFKPYIAIQQLLICSLGTLMQNLTILLKTRISGPLGPVNSSSC